MPCGNHIADDRQADEMESERVESRDVKEEEEEGTPVCPRCFQPVDPLDYYCPNCGETTGQLTPYIPYVGIPWAAACWGRVWRKVWSSDISIPGRLFGLLIIVWIAPIMLIGLLFRFGRKQDENQQCEHGTEPDRREGSAPD